MQLLSDPAAATSAFGTITELNTSSLGNNDVVVTTGFTPRIIKLHYFLQGHGRSSDSNFYYGIKGIATYNGTTLVADNRIWGNDQNAPAVGTALTGDNGSPSSVTGADLPNFTDSTVAPTVGGAALGITSAIGLTLSIPSTSATGFTIRQLTASTSGTPLTARAKIYYEAYA